MPPPMSRYYSSRSASSPPPDLIRRAGKYLPRRVKSAFKTGIGRAAIKAVQRVRARMVTLSLDSTSISPPSPEDRAAAADMSVIVPIHDAPIVTQRCLASLERYGSEAEVILVDDASALRETTDMLCDFRDRNGWKLISKRVAGGHSAACKDGGDAATRPYLCLLNSDTVVTPWCWSAIEEAFEKDDAIGVAGPSTSRCGTGQVLSVARDCRFEWTDGQICSFAKRVKAKAGVPSIVDLPWAGGFALFIRRALWLQLNGFDQNLPDYGNEVELCKRAKDAGYRIVWARKGYIHHLGAQSYGQYITQDEIQGRKDAGDQYLRAKYPRAV